jgi:hypothetical protein
VDLFLLIAPAVWLAMFARPPVFASTTAKHSPIGIWKPEGPLNRDGSVTVYAHVQEKGEYRLAKIGGILAGLAFIWVPFDPVVYLLQPIAMAVADQAVRFFPGTDYAGHGAEIIAAERDGAVGYRAAEIERMSDDRDKQGQDIEAGLRRWHWLAVIVHFLGSK